MEARAKATFERIAPRKVQCVLDLIRNKPADEAALNTHPRLRVNPLQSFLNLQWQMQKITSIWMSAVFMLPNAAFLRVPLLKEFVPEHTAEPSA